MQHGNNHHTWCLECPNKVWTGLFCRRVHRRRQIFTSLTLKKWYKIHSWGLSRWKSCLVHFNRHCTLDHVHLVSTLAMFVFICLARNLKSQKKKKDWKREFWTKLKQYRISRRFDQAVFRKIETETFVGFASRDRKSEWKMLPFAVQELSRNEKTHSSQNVSREIFVFRTSLLFCAKLRRKPGDCQGLWLPNAFVFR